MAYIQRNLETIISQITREYPVLLLSGPRQVGKTTLLKKMMEGTDRGYVTLDDMRERELARSDPRLFLELHHAPVLIDEVQYAPELFPTIKMEVDSRQNPGDYWLTSSHDFPLMRGVQESLAGRVALLSLPTLSQAELCGAPDSPFVPELESLKARTASHTSLDLHAIYQRIFRGSMPAVVSGEVSEPELFYPGYISFSLERDVLQLSRNIDMIKFFRFMTTVAARCSQLLNIADIARDADITQREVKDWLNILETLGIIFYLHPYSNNLLKRLIKTPKLYFYDTGLVCHLTRWTSPEVLESGAMSGAILEDYVVSELMKTSLNAGLIPNLYYYRDRDGQEIDVVLEQDGRLHPLKIKRSANPGSELTRVFSVLDKASLPRGKGAILCLYPTLNAIDRENFIVPIWSI